MGFLILGCSHHPVDKFYYLEGDFPSKYSHARTGGGFFIDVGVAVMPTTYSDDFIKTAAIQSGRLKLMNHAADYMSSTTLMKTSKNSHDTYYVEEKIKINHLKKIKGMTTCLENMDCRTKVLVNNSGLSQKLRECRVLVKISIQTFKTNLAMTKDKGK